MYFFCTFIGKNKLTHLHAFSVNEDNQSNNEKLLIPEISPKGRCSTNNQDNPSKVKKT